MIEYTVAAVILMITVVTFSIFLYVFKAHSGRVLDLAASVYP